MGRPNLRWEWHFRRLGREKLRENWTGAKNTFQIPNCSFYSCRRYTSVLIQHGRVSHKYIQAGVYTAWDTGVFLPMSISINFTLYQHGERHGRVSARVSFCLFWYDWTWLDIRVCSRPCIFLSFSSLANTVWDTGVSLPVLMLYAHFAQFLYP